MSSILEFKNGIAFHPGYYIKELIEESGLTQEDFAKRLDTTPKNLSLLVRGEQSLSVEMALKLSRMTGSSVNYWLNLQTAFDTKKAEFRSLQELEEERKVFKFIDYRYFREHFGLPDHPRKVDEQIAEVRRFLNVSTLCVFKKPDMTVSFRAGSSEMEEQNIIRVNIMVQIAANKALKTDSPKFDKTLFAEKVDMALGQTRNHSGFYPVLKKAFLEAGVVFVVLPNLSGSQLNGATKKIGGRVMLMVSDRRLYSDVFWFTLFHEIGHIMNEDYGVSFEREKGAQEEIANKYAENMLIPADAYQSFINQKRFSLASIEEFADTIGRDPGIVLGRLENDGFVGREDQYLSKNLRYRYRVA